MADFSLTYRQLVTDRLGYPYRLPVNKRVYLDRALDRCQLSGIDPRLFLYTLFSWYTPARSAKIARVKYPTVELLSSWHAVSLALDLVAGRVKVPKSNQPTLQSIQKKIDYARRQRVQGVDLHSLFLAGGIDALTYCVLHPSINLDDLPSHKGKEVMHALSIMKSNRELRRKINHLG